jgi:hypothetical protein
MQVVYLESKFGPPSWHIWRCWLPCFSISSILHFHFSLHKVLADYIVTSFTLAVKQALNESFVLTWSIGLEKRRRNLLFGDLASHPPYFQIPRCFHTRLLMTTCLNIQLKTNSLSSTSKMSYAHQLTPQVCTKIYQNVWALNSYVSDPL